MMDEHEIRLRALELVVERRADWQTTDQIIATARSYAEFVLGISSEQRREAQQNAEVLLRAQYDQYKAAEAAEAQQ